MTSSMSLVDGQVVVRSQGEELRSSRDGTNFNDDEWHVVTATHSDDSLRLDIDDTENYSTDAAPPSLHILRGSLYIGGFPTTESFDPYKGPASIKSFVGCIGDATLNGVIINFANTTHRPGAFLGKCKGGDQTRKLSSDYQLLSPT